MRATELLTQQFRSGNIILHDIAADLTDAEWTTCFLPGTNLPGFDLWHIARAQDWAVQTLARGVPEVLYAPTWANLSASAAYGIGIGLTSDEADALAFHIQKHDVLAYADAVHREILAWLATIDDALLDTTPDIAQHYAAHPEYQTAAMVEEVPWLATNPPMWRCLAPGIGHVRDHLAEIDLAKRCYRQSAARG